ncbi:unnamed protein product [Brassica oleracea]
MFCISSLPLCRNTTVCLIVFEGLTMLLHNKLVTSGVEPLMMNINLKLVGGRLISPHSCSAFLFMFFCWHFAISNKLVFKAWMYARNSYRASFLASSSRRLYFDHLSLVESLSYINPCHLFLFHPICY